MTPISNRDNNFNKDQIKGLNMVINATKKKILILKDGSLATTLKNIPLHYILIY